MAMPDLRGLLDQGLDLPIGGKVYTIPPPSARVGLRLQLLRDLDSIERAGMDISESDKRLLQLTDNEQVDFLRDCLGNAYDEMIDGGVTMTELNVAAGAAFLCWTASEGHGREDAETYLRAVADPQMAATDQQSPMTLDARGSGATAAASTTKRPSSGSGTTSRKASAPRAARTATRSAV